MFNIFYIVTAPTGSLAFVTKLEFASAAASEIIHSIRGALSGNDKKSGVVSPCLTVEQFTSKTDEVVKNILLAYQQMLSCLDSGNQQPSSANPNSDPDSDESLTDKQLVESIDLFKNLAKFSSLSKVLKFKLAMNSL